METQKLDGQKYESQIRELRGKIGSLRSSSAEMIYTLREEHKEKDEEISSSLDFWCFPVLIFWEGG